MTTLTRAVDKARRTVERARGMRALANDDSAAAGAIFAAVRAARDDVFTPDERAWVDRIEALRARLNASTRELTRVDFGAGRPDSERDAGTMSEGVRVVETLGQVARNASKSPFWCRFLFALVRAARPGSCIEMGAAVGISGAYQSAALQLNGHGRLATLEGAASLAEITAANLRELGLEGVDVVVGRFDDTLAPAIAARGPLDYVFVDGHHDEDATLAYFETLLPKLAPGALLVFDDIAWSPGMQRAWRRIANDARVALSVDLGAIGVCAVDTASRAPRRYRVPLH